MIIDEDGRLIFPFFFRPSQDNESANVLAIVSSIFITVLLPEWQASRSSSACAGVQERERERQR